MATVDERRRWTDSADAWGRWAEQMAEPADRINRPLLALADVRPGLSILDLATGTGEPALTLADLAGPAGFVVGTDLVPAMLAHTASRARARALPLRMAAADMQALPYPDGAFDRVIVRFGLMFVPDADAALREMGRVLRPGGRLALAVWGPLTDNTLFREIRSALDEVIGLDPAYSLAPLFRFAAEGSLAALLAAAGLVGVIEQPLRLDHAAPAARPFWRPTLEMGFTPRLMGLSEAGRAAAETAVARRFQELSGADGNVRVGMHVRLATALRA